MKKLTAILFLLLLSFNLIGYRLLFYYAQQQSDLRLQAALDNAQYDEAELITLRIPLSLPYVTDTKDFERMDGEVNFQGKIYKYVKRKVEDGQLVLLCLPDYQKMHLQKVKSDFFKNISDIIPGSGTKKPEKAKAGATTNMASEYEPFTTNSLPAVFALEDAYLLSKNVLQTIAFPHTSPEQPPEVI